MKEREEWLFTSLLQHWYKWAWAELTFEISEKHSTTKISMKISGVVVMCQFLCILFHCCLNFYASLFPMVVLQRIYHIPTTKAPLFDTWLSTMLSKSSVCISSCICVGGRGWFRGWGDPPPPPDLACWLREEMIVSTQSGGLTTTSTTKHHQALPPLIPLPPNTKKHYHQPPLGSLTTTSTSITTTTTKNH